MGVDLKIPARSASGKSDPELEKILFDFFSISKILEPLSVDDKYPGIKLALALQTAIFNQAVTMYNLWRNGSSLTSMGISSFNADLLTVIPLAKSAMESYLTFNYLFVSPNSETEKEFKLLCWELGREIEMDNILCPPAISKKVILEDSLKIKALKERIQNHVFLKDRSLRTWQLAMSGQWRLKYSWHDIGLRAGFKKRYFNYKYNYLCALSGSGPIGIERFENSKSTKAITFSCMQLCKMVLAKFIYEYANLKPEFNQHINLYTEEFHYIRLWKDIAEEFDWHPSETMLKYES